ncbi:MAG: type II toxin-antitoxin system ParD family antitoxin [Hyphomonadaceae bacterium]
MEIALPDDLEQFIRQQVDSGVYANAAAVIDDALRRLAAERELSYQARIDLLRQALQPGLNDIAAGRVSDRSVGDFMRDAAAPR